MSDAKRIAFAWQDKISLRRIREQIPDYGSALAVYVALTVVASDKESDEFQTTQEWVAQLSGFDARTVRRRLPDLERIGVVKITTPPLRVPSTYRLLRSAMVSQRKDIVSERSDTVRPLLCPTSEERKEEKILPTAKGKGGLKAMFEEKLAEELNHE